MMRALLAFLILLVLTFSLNGIAQILVAAPASAPNTSHCAPAMDDMAVLLSEKLYRRILKAGEPYGHSWAVMAELAKAASIYGEAIAAFSSVVNGHLEGPVHRYEDATAILDQAVGEKRHVLVHFYRDLNKKRRQAGLKRASELAMRTTIMNIDREGILCQTFGSETGTQLDTGPVKIPLADSSGIFRLVYFCLINPEHPLCVPDFKPEMPVDLNATLSKSNSLKEIVFKQKLINKMGGYQTEKKPENKKIEK